MKLFLPINKWPSKGILMSYGFDKVFIYNIVLFIIIDDKFFLQDINNILLYV